MNNFNAKLFSIRLLNKRRVYGLSLRDTAKEMGVSAPTLSRLETQKSPPDLATYYLCCKWLGLDLEYFFTEIT